MRRVACVLLAILITATAFAGCAHRSANESDYLTPNNAGNSGSVVTSGRENADREGDDAAKDDNEEGKVHSGGLFSSFKTITYDGTDYKSNPDWEYHVGLVVETTNDAARSAGLTCITFCNISGREEAEASIVEEDGGLCSLQMFYDNTYDEVLQGRQQVSMSAIIETNTEYLQTIVTVYDENNDIIFSSVVDADTAYYYDKDDNTVLFREDRHSLEDLEGNTYSKEDAWNYLVSIEPRLAYIGRDSFGLNPNL